MLRVFLLFISFFLFFTPTAFAARKIFISADKVTLSGEEEVLVSASPSGFTDNEKIYIKGAFYKEGSLNYFGYTKFGTSWIKNSVTAKSQREIDFSDWDNILAVRADFDDSGFSGNGDYKLKIGFYYTNSNGNLSSVNWSENVISFSIVEPTKAPVLESSSLDTNEVYDDHIDDGSSNSTLTITPAVKKSITRNPTEFDKITSSPKTASEYAKIEPITETDEGEIEAEVLGAKDSLYSKTLVVTGGVFFVIAGFILFRAELKRRGGL